MRRGRSAMARAAMFAPLVFLGFLVSVKAKKPSAHAAPKEAQTAGGGAVEALPARITLAQALDVLKRQSPRAEAAKAQVEVAAADRITARAHPNPTFGYSGLALALGANLGAVWEHQLAVEQPILLFGQRGARRQLADAHVRATRARVVSELWERVLALRKAFVALLGHQERVELLKKSAKDLERIVKIVLGRKSAGDQSLYDVARIELEMETHRLEQERAQTDLEDASGALAALLGMPGYRPLAEGSLEPASIPASEGDLWRSASENHPAILAARAYRAFAQGELTLARRERLPVPSAVLGVNFTQDERSTSVIFGVSIPLPIFDRGKGAVARAKASITAESKALDAELAEIQAELGRAQRVYMRQLATLRRMEEGMLKRLPEIRRMAEKSYREGGSTFLDLLDAFRTIKSLELAHLEQREAVKTAEAKVIVAAALEPVSGAQ